MKTSLSKEEILKMRRDPANFRFGRMFYACREDPYVILPKEIKWLGWTVNMAHPDAAKTMAGLGLFTALPVLAAIILFQNITAVSIAVAAGTILLCVWCARESRLP